jgi:hypothetical protein
MCCVSVKQGIGVVISLKSKLIKLTAMLNSES